MKNTKSYENAYLKLFRFLYEDKERSPLYYDPYKYGADTIIRYDGSHDFLTYALVHEFVEESRKLGINPWQMLRFGAQIKENDWVRNKPPEWNSCPKRKTPTLPFILNIIGGVSTNFYLVFCSSLQSSENLC